jgi:hypothetical protein
VDETLPRELIAATELLATATGSVDSKSVNSIRDGICLCNDIVENISEHKSYVDHIKYRLVVKMSEIILGPEPLDDALWFEYLLIFCIELKPELEILGKKDSGLFLKVKQFFFSKMTPLAPALVANIKECFESVSTV